jgi:hypothetical protein
MSGTAGTTVGGISIPIMAVDNATAVINRVTRNLQGLAGPTQRFGQMTNRAASNVFGLNKLSDGMSSLGSHTRDVARSMERIAPAIGLITGAVTLGGLLALENRFANVGQSAGNLGQRLGIPVDRLTELQGAAKLGGVTAEDMSSGLQALDEGLRSATFRGDGLKIQTFNALGVSFGEIGKHARTADEAIREVANGIQRLDKTEGRGAALRAAQNLGLEGLFPVLLKGGAGIDALVAKTKRLGGVISPQMLQRAEALHEGFQSVAIAAEGFANRLADAVSPQFTRMSEGFATWIARIAPDFSRWIGTLATRLENWLTNDLDWTPLTKGFDRFTAWVNSLSAKDFTEFGETLKTIGGEVADLATRAAQFGDEISKWKFSEAFEREIAFLKELKYWIHDVPYKAGQSFREYLNQPTPNAEQDTRSWWQRLFEPGPGLFDGWGGGDARLQAPPRDAIGLPQTGSGPSDVMTQVHDFFAAKGVPEENIAGILANIQAESGFNPNALGDPDKEGHYTSLGLFQEHGPRMKALQAQYGPTPGVIDQLNFAWNEPAMQAALRAMRGQGSAQSGAIFSRGFEVPAGGIAEDMRRGAAAQQFVGAVHVSVDVNARTGAVNATSTASGIATTSPVRIASPMPTAGGH